MTDKIINSVKILDPSLINLLEQGYIFHKRGTDEYLALKKYNYLCIVNSKTLKFRALYKKDIEADYDPQAIEPNDRLKLFLFQNL